MHPSFGLFPKKAKYYTYNFQGILDKTLQTFVTINSLTAFYLILCSFRHLAYSPDMVDNIVAPLIQGLLLITFTSASYLIKNVAGQHLVAACVSLLPWIVVLTNALLSVLMPF